MEILEGDWGYGQTTSQEELTSILMAYQQAVDFSVISSITDIKGKIIYVNKQFCEISKYSAEELIGKNHNMINSGHHSKAFFKEMWKTIGGGNVWYGEIKNLAKDQSIYWVNSVIVPIKNADGQPRHYLSLRTLISERKAQEEKKHEMHAKNMEDMLTPLKH
ncbi:PAS domain-containing protein [Pedobacter immunditicola]|uniref:PAS domain-containing protein n=1 Tax=Pedobacter immunditicola TaxID=3133440 RepID=UPI0030AE21EC